MKNTEIIAILVKKAKKLSNGEKLKLKDVNFFLDTFEKTDSDSIEIISALEDKNYLVAPSGYASMSSLQLKIHRFINESMLGQLMESGQCKLVVSEDDLACLLEEDKGKYFILNKKGDLIKPSCNNTNITHNRKVAELKKKQEQLQSV